jgi:hypothetical protein
MSGFRLVPYRLHFGRSAWQEVNYYRAQRAAIVANAQALLDTASSSLFGALQNQASGAANNAAQVALDRINALAQATKTKVTSQIDQAQAVLNASKGSSVNTVA